METENEGRRTNRLKVIGQNQNRIDYKKAEVFMKIEIYINNKPIEESDPKELEEIKVKLTERAFAAAGYERVKSGEAHG